MEHLDENAAAELLAGTLTHEAQERLQGHLDGCAECRAFFAELGRGRTHASPTSPARPTLAPEPLAKGTVVGRYVVSHLVGQGGMGVVYAAYDLELDRRIALKLLSPERDTPELRARLLREAQAMAQLSHPHVVPVYDVGTHEGSVFLAMELIEGQTLAAWLRSSPRTVPEILQVLQSAGQGLAAAHAAQLIHRDFKPDNVLIGVDGRVRVTDFGLARPTGASEVFVEGAARTQASPGPLTQTGTLIGTPAYMAPEQHLQQPVDARTDQFSFCVTLYEALYGARPFPTGTFEEARAAVLAGRVREPSSRSGVPARVRRLVLRGLSADPAQRFPSMAELLTALAPRARRRWRLVGASVAVALLAGAVGGDQLRRGALCRGASQKLSAVWNPARREAITQAFRAVGKPYGEAALQASLSGLDALSAAWVQQRTEVCEATHLRGEQSAELLDLRISCLDRQLGELGAVVEVLSEVDAATLEDAPDAVLGPSALKECADAELLLWRARRRGAGALTDEELALTQRHAELAARSRAGQFKVALEGSLALGEGTDSARGAPIWASLLLQRAQLQRKLATPDAATPTVMKSLHAAEASGAEEVQLKAWSELALIRAKGERQAGAEEALAHASALLQRFPQPGALAYPVLSVQAELAIRREDFAAAEGFQRQLLAVKTRELGADSPGVALTLSNLGHALLRRGRYAEAEEVTARSLELKRARLGEDHPSLGPGLERLAKIASARGDWDQALAVGQRLLALRLQTYGPDHALVASARRDLGVLYLELRRPVEALNAAGSALALHEKLFPGDHKSKAISLLDLAIVERVLGSPERGEALLARACPMLQRTLGESAIPYGSCLAEEARALARRGQHRQAVALAVRALAIREKGMGEAHSDLASTLLLVGEEHLALGDRGQALPAARRALLLREKDGRAPTAIAEARFVLARALAQGGSVEERAQAAALAQGAAETFRAHGREPSAAKTEQLLEALKRRSR